MRDGKDPDLVVYGDRVVCQVRHGEGDEEGAATPTASISNHADRAFQTALLMDREGV